MNKGMISITLLPTANLQFKDYGYNEFTAIKKLFLNPSYEMITYILYITIYDYNEIYSFARWNSV
jgi:hypothetical protein